MRVTDLRRKFRLIVWKRVVAASFPPCVHRHGWVRSDALVHKWWRAGTTVIGLALVTR